MLSITALILTYNENENIERTVRALHWLEKIVIIDSFSTDDTIQRARECHPGVIAISRDFDTHAAQWNFGLGQISTSWVLALDADYEVTAALAREIQDLIPATANGYSACFQFRIFSRNLRTSVYPAHIVLFRREGAHYVDDGHTQRLVITGEVARLTGEIVHDDRKPLTRWLAAQDRYAQIEVAHLLQTSDAALNFADRLRKKVFLAPPVMFLYLLFVKGLALDGWSGWFYVVQRVIAELFLSLRLCEAKLRSSSEDGDTKR